MSSDEADQADVEQALENLTKDFETPHANQCQIDFEHRLVEPEDAPDELAIFPREECAGLLTEWIVATGEESFVDLTEMR